MIANKLISQQAISPSVLYLVNLPDTKSRIIKQNNFQIYCAKYPRLKGLFRKDIKETKSFGRKFCDYISEKRNNQGFFTSDERPKYGISYGISEEEYDYIFEQISADPEHHLVVMFAYSEKESLETQTSFEIHLRQLYLEQMEKEVAI